MVSKASLGLQMSIYFDRIYSVIFFFSEIIIYIFKANFLVYPRGYLAPDIVGLFFFLILQYVKLDNANTANKTEIGTYHLYTILFSIPVILIYLYYMYHQIYCLVFDLFLSIFGVFFTGMELFLSIYVLCFKL